MAIPANAKFDDDGNLYPFYDADGNGYYSASERDAAMATRAPARVSKASARKAAARKVSTAVKPKRTRITNVVKAGTVDIDPYDFGSLIPKASSFEKLVKVSSGGFPKFGVASLDAALKEVLADPSMAEIPKLLMERKEEFSSPMAAMMAGVFNEPAAYRYVDSILDTYWAQESLPSKAYEVIVGGGLHAAIYASVRRALGYPKPVVLEQKPRVGGAFAVSRNASFFLNSRNRPGRLLTPGQQDGSLNFLPGAPVQPADLGGRVWQTNAEMAFAIRMALAMHAKVIPNARVVDAAVSGSGVVNLQVEGGRKVVADRVIWAEGLGKPVLPVQSKYIVSFEEFMAMMDEPFPLRGKDRVAVLGQGDGGKTAIEALTGLGPAPGLSVASLDRPRTIDWYGPGKSMTCVLWRESARSRYREISSLLPGASGRVTPKEFGGTAEGYLCGYVDGTPYDLVIDARGYQGYEYGSRNIFTPFNFSPTGRNIAYVDETQRRFVVGPGAQLPDEGYETFTVPENRVAIFRYAPRTAQLASTLN